MRTNARKILEKKMFCEKPFTGKIKDIGVGIYEQIFVYLKKKEK